MMMMKFTLNLRNKNYARVSSENSLYESFEEHLNEGISIPTSNICCQHNELQTHFAYFLSKRLVPKDYLHFRHAMNRVLGLATALKLLKINFPAAMAKKLTMAMAKTMTMQASKLQNLQK